MLRGQPTRKNKSWPRITTRLCGRLKGMECRRCTNDNPDRCDPDLPHAPGLRLCVTSPPAEADTLAEELLAYHRHFAPLFQRREQREWARCYLRGLLTAEVPAQECRSHGPAPAGSGATRRATGAGRATVCGRGRWTMRRSWPSISAWCKRRSGTKRRVHQMARSFLNMRPSVGVAPSGVGIQARRIAARRGCFWAMPAAGEPRCWTGGLDRPSPGLREDDGASVARLSDPRDDRLPVKHDLAAELVEQVIASGRIQAQWVVCDEGYGDCRLPERLDGTGLWYLAEVPREIAGLAAARSRWTETPRPRPRSWVRPQTRSHKVRLRRERCIPPAQAKSRWRTWPKRGPLRLAAVSSARGTQRPAGRRFPRAARRAAS